MKSKKSLTWLALFIVFSMALSACGGAQPAAVTEAPAQPAPATEAPTQPPAATEVPTQAPAATEAPTQPTPTQEPVEPSGTGEQIELYIMHNWGPDDAKGAPLQSVFADFMAANPDVVIRDEVFLDSDIPLKVETAYAGGQEPDLVFVQRAGTPVTWTDAGITVPVNDYIQEWGLGGQFTDVALNDFTQGDGKIQAFPLEGFTWPIWYNTSLLGEAGVEVPMTADELIEVANQLRAAGKQPFVIGGGDWTGMFFFQLVVESMLTNEETWQVLGDGDWTNPNAVKGVELFVNLRDAGVFVDGIEGLDFATMNEMYFSGEAAMIHAGAWSFGEAPEDLRDDIVLGGFPLPEGSPHQNPVIYSAFTAKGIWITRNGTEKLDAIQRFVEFIYQPEMIARFVEQAGMTPPLKEVPVDEAALNSLFVQSLDMPVDVVMTQDLVVPPAVAPEFERITKLAFVPGTTAEQILEELTAAYQANQ